MPLSNLMIATRVAERSPERPYSKMEVNRTHDGGVNWYFTDCDPRNKDEDRNQEGEPELLGNGRCTTGTREVPRVFRVLEIGGYDEDPNEGQLSPTRKTVMLFKDIVMSLTDGGDSTED
jgi:hypothetical protein